MDSQDKERIAELEKATVVKTVFTKPINNRFDSYEDIHAYKIMMADTKRKEMDIQFNQAYE
jgi:hypothetical protein